MKILTLLAGLGLATQLHAQVLRPTTSDQVQIEIAKTTPIKIKWVSGINGNFSFRHKWSYPEGIFRNNYGQLTCDGFCPDEIESLKDKNGRIVKDSLTSFYKLIDTSHIPHSISSTAWCYEWGGIDFIDAIKNTDTIFLASALNSATHCRLQLSIAGDYCYPLINLISIVKGGSGIYYCSGGSITIDKTLFKKGIVKAIFSFNFKHEEDPKEPMFWKGKIYALITIQP